MLTIRMKKPLWRPNLRVKKLLKEEKRREK